MNIFLANILKHIKTSFLGSIVIGIVIWFFFFFTLPIEVKNPLSSTTVWFIIANYAALITGYFLLKRSNRFPKKIKQEKSSIDTFLNFVTVVVFIAAVLRFIDLFFIREVSFFNSIEQNKYNVSQEENFSLIMGLLSMFRLLYFVPFVLYRISKRKRKTLLIVTILFFLIPILEGYLRGSRRLILEPVLIFGVTFLMTKTSKFKLNWKQLIVGFGMLLVMFLSSEHILKERLQKTGDPYEKALFAAQYNDFIPLNQKTKEYIVENKENTLSSILLFYGHLGQYITHGVFEFDHMKTIASNPKMGLYNGYIVVKFFNKIGLTNYSLEALHNPSERITYITFFGGLYLDFRWLSVVIMFLFGALQQKMFSWSEKYFALKPILILFVLTNMMMLVFNFFRAQVLITILVYLFVLMIFKVIQKQGFLISDPSSVK